MERCPFCRARLRGLDLCSRCGADLTLVQRAERGARRAVAGALEALVRGDLDAAEVSLRRARTLREDPGHGFVEALIRHQRAREQRRVAPALANTAVAREIPPIQPRRWWF